MQFLPLPVDGETFAAAAAHDLSLEWRHSPDPSHQVLLYAGAFTDDADIG